MSHSRRYLKTNALTDLPEPTEDEKIAQVLELRGSNLVEVECADGEKILCQIPTKFRKLVWIRRGKNKKYLYISDMNNNFRQFYHIETTTNYGTCESERLCGAHSVFTTSETSHSTKFMV